MKKLVLLFISFTCLAAFYASAINFSRVNVAWQYDKAFEVRLLHRVVGGENANSVFLKVYTDSLASWQFEFLAQSGYESEEHKTIKPASVDTLVKQPTSVLLKLDFPKMDENLLVVKFFQPSRFFYYDINMKIGSFSFPGIYPIDDKGLPILEKYINRSGSSWKGNDEFLAMQYTDNFPPADPPMAEMKPLAPQVDLDTTLVFSGLSEFEEQKFYTVRRDSAAALGVTMLRMPPYFPDSRQLPELVEAMFYLTSEPEKKSIINAKNLKQNFDSFWMNTYDTQSKARAAIRRYYTWVRNANRLFTDFKPGWKTDRGMMYIVFGAPDEVYRTGNSEEWYYDDGKAFEFTVISSFFAPRTYSLRRNGNFQELWFNQITYLRRGI